MASKEPDRIQPTPENDRQITGNINKLRMLIKELGPDPDPGELLARYKSETGQPAREIGLRRRIP